VATLASLTPKAGLVAQHSHGAHFQHVNYLFHMIILIDNKIGVIMMKK
jgi:hypothetical protein